MKILYVYSNSEIKRMSVKKLEAIIRNPTKTTNICLEKCRTELQNRGYEFIGKYR